MASSGLRSFPVPVNPGMKQDHSGYDRSGRARAHRSVESPLREGRHDITVRSVRRIEVSKRERNQSVFLCIDQGGFYGLPSLHAHPAKTMRCRRIRVSPRVPKHPKYLVSRATKRATASVDTIETCDGGKIAACLLRYCCRQYPGLIFADSCVVHATSTGFLGFYER